MSTNLVPRSRGWAKPKARSGQVRKFDFFDWLFQNMAVTALKFERALRGFSGPLGNSMTVFMQIRHCVRNHNICILGTFRCYITVGLKSQEDFFSVLHRIIKLFLTNNNVPP